MLTLNLKSKLLKNKLKLLKAFSYIVSELNFFDKITINGKYNKFKL